MHTKEQIINAFKYALNSAKTIEFSGHISHLWDITIKHNNHDILFRFCPPSRKIYIGDNIIELTEDETQEILQKVKERDIFIINAKKAVKNAIINEFISFASV